MVWQIRCRENGNVIEEVATETEAMKIIARYEAEDREGTEEKGVSVYIPNFYDVIYKHTEGEKC